LTGILLQIANMHEQEGMVQISFRLFAADTPVPTSS
jgi:hypothetical protein